MIRHPNALEPDNIMAYDNAVSALGKICQFHRDSIDSSQVLPHLYFNPPPPHTHQKKIKKKKKEEEKAIGSLDVILYVCQYFVSIEIT